MTKSPVRVLIAAALVAAPAVVRSQDVRPQGTAVAAKDSVGSVMRFVKDTKPVTDILEAVNIDCYTFAFDQLQQNVRDVAGYANLTESLKRRCALLRIESDPAGATVKIGGREMGTVSPSGDAWWVEPGQVPVTVTLGSNSRSKTFDVQANKVVQATFKLPKDTVAWPTVRTARDVARDKNILSIWRPPAGGPIAPVRPAKMSAMSTGFLWGLIGAAGGAATAKFVPSLGCYKSYTATGKGAYVNGQKVNAGQTVNLGSGAGCMATVAAGSGLGMFVLSALIKSSSNHGAMSAYDDALKAYPGERQKWEDDQLNQFLSASPEIRIAIAEDQRKLDATKSDNEQVRRYNGSLGDPTFTTRNRATATDEATSNAIGMNVVSDVDIDIPKAIAQNPNALAVVVGNRDYRGRDVPKVDYAIRDAESVAHYLVTAFGFDSNRVLLEKNLSAAEMFDLFGNSDPSASRIADLMKTRDSVDLFVFYSGHGAPDRGSRFIVPVDADFDRLANTGFPLDKLYKNLGAMKARSVTVVIDACFSGSYDGGVVQKGRSGAELEPEVETVAGGSTQVFTAVSPKETARWYKEQGHGLFTYYFLKGVKGEADANKDGIVSAGELSQYVRTNVTRTAAEKLRAPQNPLSIIADPKHVILRLPPQ